VVKKEHSISRSISPFVSVHWADVYRGASNKHVHTNRSVFSC